MASRAHRSRLEIPAGHGADGFTEPRGRDLAAWGRELALLRVVLALLCLAIQHIRLYPDGRNLRVLTGAYLIFGLAALVWRPAKRMGSEFLGLIADATFFLAFVMFFPGPGWFGSALFVYLMFSTLLVHHWWDVFIVAGACGTVVTVDRPAAGEGIWYVVVWAGFLACMAALGKRSTGRLLIAAIRECEDGRLRAEQARESERQRIAGDFHDGPLQSFISLQIRLEALRKILQRNPAAGLEELGEIQELSRSQIAELRAFVKGTRAVEVSGEGLVASLRRVAADFQKESGITVNFRSGESVNIESPEKSVEIVQIVREALHNAQKHSGATQTAVSVNQFADFLEVAVEDNGGGFSFSGAFHLGELDLLRLGPASIKHRTAHLGGELVVESRPGHGASIRVRVPV